MNDNFKLELQAWLDGELPAGKGQRIETEIARDEEAGCLVAELRFVKDTLAPNEMARTIPETREFYWSKIEREIQRQAEAPAPRRAVWPGWLAPAAGFGALACLLLLAVNPMVPPAFNETSAAGEGVEAITFHDQAAEMTVVWLDDTAPDRPAESPALKTPHTGNPEVEVE
jgi:anti-sigma factor RsiW